MHIHSFFLLIYIHKNHYQKVRVDNIKPFLSAKVHKKDSDFFFNFKEFMLHHGKVPGLLTHLVSFKERVSLIKCILV